ncbi:MAG: hypothetical protein LBN29_11265 [Mediterranea sp.]|jgi:hypothetical protein|nr:hypothetical protein [Mediterranea sp.]
MSEVKGSTTITFVRQGDSLQTGLRATLPLAQYLKRGTAAVQPDWTVADNQPVIYPVTRSSLTDTRVPPDIDSDTWRLGGLDIPFAADGLSEAFGAVPAGTFRRGRMAIDGDVAVPTLTILRNLATPGGSNARLDFAATASTGFTAGIAASIDIRLEEVEGDPYVGYVSVNDGGVIDADTDELRLRANLLRGGAPATGNVGYRWLKNRAGEWGDTGRTAREIVITADDIDNQELYMAEMYVGGSVVATATMTVHDERDPLIIVPNPDGEEQLTSTRRQIVYAPKVVRRGDTGLSALPGYGFAYRLTNSRFDTIAKGEGDTFVVTYGHGQSAGGNLTLNIDAKKK